MTLADAHAVDAGREAGDLDRKSIVLPAGAGDVGADQPAGRVERPQAGGSSPVSSSSIMSGAFGSPGPTAPRGAIPRSRRSRRRAQAFQRRRASSLPAGRCVYCVERAHIAQGDDGAAVFPIRKDRCVPFPAGADERKVTELAQETGC